MKEPTMRLIALSLLVLASTSVMVGCGSDTEQEKLARELNQQIQETKAKKEAQKPMSREEWDRRTSELNPLK